MLTFLWSLREHSLPCQNVQTTAERSATDPSKRCPSKVSLGFQGLCWSNRGSSSKTSFPVASSICQLAIRAYNKVANIHGHKSVQLSIKFLFIDSASLSQSVTPCSPSRNCVYLEYPKFQANNIRLQIMANRTTGEYVSS